MKQTVVANHKTPTTKSKPISTATVTKKSSSFSSPLHSANSNSIEKEVYLTPKNDFNEKENCSPAASKNIFDNLEMTPISTPGKIIKSSRKYDDHLASLPTPTLKTNYDNISDLKSLICARKLAVEASPEPPEKSPNIVINKTFNVRGKLVPNITISSELCVIEEEGKLPNEATITRSKRDITLVGTPLRKLSESMKDLSSSKVITLF